MSSTPPAQMCSCWFSSKTRKPVFTKTLRNGHRTARWVTLTWLAGLGCTGLTPSSAMTQTRKPAPGRTFFVCGSAAAGIWAEHRQMQLLCFAVVLQRLPPCSTLAADRCVSSADSPAPRRLVLQAGHQPRHDVGGAPGAYFGWAPHFLFSFRPVHLIIGQFKSLASSLFSHLSIRSSTLLQLQTVLAPAGVPHSSRWGRPRG